MVVKSSAKNALLALEGMLPLQAKHALMCTRRIPIWRRHNIIFVHIPKAAGTSVAHALYGRSTGHMTAAQIVRYCPRTFARCTSFAIGRNPWDRLVSAYRFVKQGGTSDAGVNKAAYYQANVFRTFESFVYEWLPENDLTCADYVFQPQSQFVLDSGSNVLVDFLGGVEDIGAVESFLRSSTRSDISIPRLNPSRRVSNYREYYSDRAMINKVGDLYKADVDLFRYDY